MEKSCRALIIIHAVQKRRYYRPVLSDHSEDISSASQKAREERESFIMAAIGTIRIHASLKTCIKPERQEAKLLFRTCSKKCV